MVDLLTLRSLREFQNGLRMRFFDCNTSDIIGYSVLISGLKVLAILSHKQGERATARLYEDIDCEPCFWMYMPINQGEYLIDICRRAACFFIRPEVIGLTVYNDLSFVPLLHVVLMSLY